MKRMRITMDVDVQDTVTVGWALDRLHCAVNPKDSVCCDLFIPPMQTKPLLEGRIEDMSGQFIRPDGCTCVKIMCSEPAIPGYDYCASHAC